MSGTKSRSGVLRTLLLFGGSFLMQSSTKKPSIA